MKKKRKKKREPFIGKLSIFTLFPKKNALFFLLLVRNQNASSAGQCNLQKKKKKIHDFLAIKGLHSYMYLHTRALAFYSKHRRWECKLLLLSMLDSARRYNDDDTSRHGDTSIRPQNNERNPNPFTWQLHRPLSFSRFFFSFFPCIDLDLQAIYWRTFFHVQTNCQKLDYLL